MKKILVFGTFDILHPGHEYFLKQAREQAGLKQSFLTAVIARDLTVKQVKGMMPQNNERQRLEQLKKTGLADQVVLGNTSDQYRIIEEVQPDIICLGYDQQAFTQNLGQELKKRGLSPELRRIKAYKPEIHKSRHYKKKNLKNPNPKHDIKWNLKKD